MRKLLCLFLSICVVFGTLCTAKAETDKNPSYLVRGAVNGNSMTLHISIKDVKAYGGRLALAYDKDILSLSDTSSVSSAVAGASGVGITGEGQDASVLLGNGHVMFGWYSGNFGYIDASDAEQEIATVSLDLINGATTSDFSRNTIGLYYVNETMVDSWSASCEIAANADGNLAAYRNTAVSDDFLCKVSFEYPNSDYIPPETYNVSVDVRNADEVKIPATVTIGNVTGQTGSDGHADFKMENGRYFYRVVSSGYEVKTGYLIVDGKDETFSPRLRSYGQIARGIADELQIGYAEGDSADSVTADLVLPTESEYGEINWESDDSAVSIYGAVTRREYDIPVTLTAYVTVEGATVSRTFNITVKSSKFAGQRDKAIVSQDKANLTIGFAPGDYEGSVTVNLTLPETGGAGSVISWSSSDEDVISPTGDVKRPEEDTTVILKALIIRGAVDTKEFTVTVKGTGKTQEETDFTEGETVVIDESSEVSDEIVQRVINSLEIGYEKDDSAESVTKKLSLPIVGTEGTAITWTSSHPAVITPYGGVVRQAEDTLVTLTATINRGSVTEIKTFTVTVKAADEIPQNPNNGQEEEIEEKNITKRGGSGGGGGGAQSAAEATPEPTAEPAATTEPAQNDTTDKIRFIDIDDVPWAQNAINTLADRGVISGTSANTYSPHLSIRRADFVMLLVKLYGLDADITDTFKDVTEDKYYYSDVSKAKSLGIISGVDETHFNPESSISRQDMMTMTYRALVKLGKAEKTEDTELTGFKDSKSVSGYALDAVKYLAGKGALHGDTDGNVNPLANTTRAETAVFLFGLTQ